MRLFILLLLSLAALSANAATIAFKDIPSTNVVNTSDQLLLNSNLGGGNYATRTIPVSLLPSASNWINSGTTNATLAGVASAGGFDLSSVLVTNWFTGPAWTTNQMDQATDNYYGVRELRLSDALNVGTNFVISGSQGLFLESPQFFSGDNENDPGHSILWGTNTWMSIVPANNDPTDASLGGVAIYALGKHLPADQSSPFSIIAENGVTNQYHDWPLVYISGNNPVNGSVFDIDPGTMLLGVGWDGSPLQIISVTAEHSFLPAAYGRVGINTNTASAALEVTAYETGVDYQKWSDVDGTLAAGVTSNKVVYATEGFLSGAPSGGGTAAAWKLGSYKTNAVTLVATNYVEVEIGGVLRKLAIVQ